MKPTIEALCEAGEKAFANDEYEEAVEWYELACAGTMNAPNTERLLAFRFDRLTELRKMVPWRKVHRLPVPDRGHVLALQATIDRQCYVDLLAWRAWTGRKIVKVDGRDTPPQGQAATFFSILQQAANRPFTYLTLFEDDIVLTKNALDYIAGTKIDDDLAFISWFSNEACTIPRTLPVLSCFRARDYQFNQAITFPARTVHKLLASDALKNWPEKHGADRIYKDVFPDQCVAVHYPNLVQHVGGANSLVGNNAHGLRTSPSFPGESFDALALV